MSNTSAGNGLRDRVRQERQQRQQSGGEVATTRDEPATLDKFINHMVGEIGRALPRHLTADRMARILLTEVRRVPNLARCTQASFGGAMMTCAQLGLEPGVSGEAYLIPFYNSKKSAYEVQLIIGYQGMAKLFWQSPLAKSLDFQAVYDNDEFEVVYGLEPKLSHKPKLRGDRGDAYAYYAVALIGEIGSAFVVMTKDDIERVRARAKAKEDGPWKTDYDAMAKKTCLRQLYKLLPRSPELSRALAQDGAVRLDMTVEGIDIEPEYPDAVEGELVDEGGNGQVVGEQQQTRTDWAEAPQAMQQKAQQGRDAEAARRTARPAAAADPGDQGSLPVEDPPAGDGRFPDDPADIDLSR